MAFMQQQITHYTKWIVIDGTHGTTFVPFDVDIKLYSMILDPNSDDLQDDIKERAADYYDGDVESVTFRTGYGARLSAPGYMDCTEWSVFHTEAAAKEHLDEMYGDEDGE